MVFLFKKILNRMDGMILFLLLIFMTISIFCIYSATWKDPSFEGSYIKMIYFYALGFAVVFAMLFFNYKILLKLSPFLYLIGLGLLVLLFFQGKTINNAQGWFTVYGLSFQPAELCKLLLILFLAYFLSKREVDSLSLMKDVIPMGVITFIPFVLVLVQPDLGNSIGYLVIYIVVCWMGNIRYRHALIGLVVIAIVSGVSLYSYVKYHDEVKSFMATYKKEYWLDRIDAVLLPELASDKATYHMDRAVVAIGSGSLKGDGYLKGSSIQSGRVPYTYSDSIFVVIGEEFGFLGCSILLILYFFLIYRMTIISLSLSSKRGIYIIAGISAMFLFQIFENIGMLIGIMPITGITLPFISYGGTSLLINMISIGLVLNIRIYDDVETESMSVGKPSVT
ncbi:FtsW/RodA/SpoVE family cell cycle protein [Paenibacillus nasutitermitis]|uniref:Rod shape-determining protein RodA n=1 Tax=Paenibacillus nasutitermitis TaxID=1652958 RepID=A0A916YRH8_9BACL|nr:FtsW/RodA/SpoVE family cell cycle protein [Paenibacillus nasutitermitis]GGD57458.1 rod shape-determining protein RodA [Paenibacillus nasutitermitis]